MAFGTSPGSPPGGVSEGYVDVLSAAELPLSTQKSVALGFQRVLLCHTSSGIHAVADLCPHALQPLLGSTLEHCVIRCAKHGAAFDLVTGKPQNGVTNKPLRVYVTRILEGRIQIAL